MNEQNKVQCKDCERWFTPLVKGQTLCETCQATRRAFAPDPRLSSLPAPKRGNQQ
jgi:hypothetical protein